MLASAHCGCIRGAIMSLLVRLLLALAAPVTTLFVARDNLNFGIIQTLVATVIAAASRSVHNCAILCAVNVRSISRILAAS